MLGDAFDSFGNDNFPEGGERIIVFTVRIAERGTGIGKSADGLYGNAADGCGNYQNLFRTEIAVDDTGGFVKNKVVLVGTGSDHLLRFIGAARNSFAVAGVFPFNPKVHRAFDIGRHADLDGFFFEVIEQVDAGKVGVGIFKQQGAVRAVLVRAHIDTQGQ